MGNTANQLSPLGQFLWAEALVTLAVAGASLGFGVEAAYSALLGGMISLVPDAYFACRVFRRYPGKSPAESAALMLRAEIVKLTLAVLMFAGVFALSAALNVVALIIGFLLAKATGMIVLVRGS